MVTEEKCQYARLSNAYSFREKGVIDFEFYWCDLSDNVCSHYTRGDYCQEWEKAKSEVKL